jgi:hypothetical protein
MNPQGLKKFFEIGLVAVVIGLLLAALPGLGFGTVSTAYALLVLALLVGLLLIWSNILNEILPVFSNGVKAVSTVVLLVMVVALALVGRRHALEERNLDVSNHLEFKATLPSPDNLSSSVITVTNGGRTAIQYRLVCHITLLVANHGGTVIGESGFQNHERAGILDAGEDAQSDACLSGILVPIQVLDCADIKVRLFYSLESQPTAKKEKDHGFVARKRGNQFEWEDRATEQKVSDCEIFARAHPVTPEERDASRAKAIETQNDAFLQTHAPMLAKTIAARLSTDILQFGVHEEANTPKSGDPEAGGVQGIMENQKKFLEWG